MEDQRTKQLKAQYNQVVTNVARNIYLKMHEVVRDINESNIREEDKDAIKLHMIGMITQKPAVNKWWRDLLFGGIITEEEVPQEDPIWGKSVKS